MRVESTRFAADPMRRPLGRWRAAIAAFTASTCAVGGALIAADRLIVLVGGVLVLVLGTLIYGQVVRFISSLVFVIACSSYDQGTIGLNIQRTTKAICTFSVIGLNLFWAATVLLAARPDGGRDGLDWAWWLFIYSAPLMLEAGKAQRNSLSGATCFVGGASAAAYCVASAAVFFTGA